MMRERGFTLLEMLVAIAVFAVLAAVAYGSLDALVSQYRLGEVQVARMTDLRRAMSLLDNDMTQAQPRGVREEFHGDAMHALSAGEDKAYPLELTRAGWSNPGGATRSDLQRVAWTLNGEVLTRMHWVMLDRAPESPPVVTRLLDGVERASWRLLDRDGEWHETWPPLDHAEGVHDDLPRAVELTLELRDWGEITRVFAR